MKKTIFLFFLIIAGRLLGDTTWVSDTICAVWDSAGSPYIIAGDVEVPAGDSLIIGPGVEVLFSGYFSIHIRDSALFKALGTETDSILFDVYDTASGYYGVYLHSAKTCSLAFCRIQNADCRYRGAITLDHTPFFISKSFFTQNRSDWGSSIYIKSNDISDTSIIQNSLFIADSLYSIFLSNTRNLTILNCIFDSNYGALLTGYPSRYNHILNCTFVNNQSERVISMSLDDGATLCINNSIFDNPLSQYATYPDDYHAYFDFSNSLIDPRKCSELYDWYSYRSRYYSWSNCIYANPQFVENSYQLSSKSPCIDSGSDSVCCLRYSGYNTMQIPDFDYYGNPREQGNGIDLGAIESPYSIENHRPNIVIHPRDTTIQLPITVRDHLWITELDGDSVSVEFVNAPGAYIENDSFFVWEPTSADAGTSEVTVIASDGELADTASFTYVIWSHSPQFMYYPPNRMIAPGDTFRDYIYAYDPDGETLDYHYKMPIEAEVIGDTQIVWIPEIGGEYLFKVKACDPYTCAQCSFKVFVGTQVSGEVCGVWDRVGSPYLLVGDVVVVPGCSLVIGPGTDIIMRDTVKISIDSSAFITAIAGYGDSIRFIESESYYCDSFLINYPSKPCWFEFVHFSTTEFIAYYGEFFLNNCNCTHVPMHFFSSEGMVSECYYFGWDCDPAIYVDSSVFQIENCLFDSVGWAIEAHNSVLSIDSIAVDISRTKIGGCVTGYNSEITVINSSFENCLYRAIEYRNEWDETYRRDGGLGAAISLHNCIIEASNNSFIDNTSHGGWGPDHRIGKGGAFFIDSSIAYIESNTFKGNYSEDFGGAIALEFSPLTCITNNLFVSNGAIDGGGGIFINSSIVEIINNTFYGQTADREGSVIYTDGCSTSIVFLNNTVSENFSWDGYSDFFIKAGRLNLLHSLLDTLYLNTDSGFVWIDSTTIIADPNFSDSLGHLSDSSSCIDAGAEFIVFEGETIWAPTEDIEGNARPCSLGWDIGCYEFYPDTSTDTTTPPPKPETFHLSIHPNPFNSAVHISSHSESKVEIFDILGKLITKIPGGEYIWKPEDMIGSGVYLVRSTLQDKTIEKKVIYLK